MYKKLINNLICNKYLVIIKRDKFYPKGDYMKKSGFTLIELIFVIVVIGLLAAVAVPKFLTTKKNAETANLPEIVKQVVTKSEEQYNLVQDDNLSNIIKNDKELNLTLDPISGKLVTTKLFKVDMNETQLDINYTKNGVNHRCVKVERIQKSVPYNPDNNVSTYVFINSELNTSCNSDVK
jgi:prepilin-type N-terminal cleavage/methylation domain-containing protein